MIDHELVFEKASYTADAIQRAVYRLSDRLSCDLTSDGDLFRCIVHVFDEDSGRVDDTLNDLRNEALDQVLRERIRNQTELARNLILSLAFSRTELTEQEDQD